MDLGRVAVRGVMGPLFVGHGTQKLFGWFGGHGPDATGGAFESMGMKPGKRHALAGGAAETAGGALLTLGALTPVASTLISSVMITAIRKVHGDKGPWVSNGGWEYNALVIAVATAFAERGPGTPSVDAARFPRLKGTGVAALSLAAAAAGSYLATSARFNEAAAETEPADDATQADDTTGDSAPTADDGDTADEPRRFTREAADATAGRA